MTNALRSKTFPLVIFMILLSCRQEHQPETAATIKKTTCTTKRTWSGDFNSDALNDTITLFALSKDVNAGYSLQLLLKLSHANSFIEKKISLTSQEIAHYWCLQVDQNWLTIGYADNKIGNFYELFFDSAAQNLELRKYSKIDFFSKIKQKQRIFDLGEVPVEISSLNVCVSEQESPVSDSIIINEDSQMKCIEVPKYCDDSKRTEGAIMLMLGLPALERIGCQ